jgi:hypothetical protein
MTQKVTDTQFIESWKKHQSATKVAAELGMTVRATSNRRVKIQDKLGIMLGATDSRARYASTTAVTDINPIRKSSARVNVEIRNGTVIVGSDAHYIPGQVTTAHRAFVKFCGDLQPRIVILNGDIFDGSTISRWPRIGWDNKPTVKEELDTCIARVDEIEAACGKARRIWTLGNHDARFETKLAATSPEYQGVKGFALKDHFPNWMPCWSVWVNDLVVKHRLANGLHAVYNNTLKSGRSICTGHLHSLKTTPWTDYNGTRYGVDSGTLAEPYGEQFTDYTEDAPLNWRSGFVVFTFHEGKLMPPELVEVIDEGVVWFRGQRITV